MQKNSYFLIGDTHPEIICLASTITQKAEQCVVSVGFYLKDREFQKCAKLMSRFGVSEQLSKRVLPKEFDQIRIVRSLAIRDCFSWVFRKSIESKFLNFVKDALYFAHILYLNLRLRVSNPSIVVCYDHHRNLLIPKNSRVTVIALVAHPKEFNSRVNQARLIYPNWKFQKNEKLQLNEKLYDRADNFVVLSNYAAESFVKFGIERSRLHTINIGPKNGNKQILTMESFEDIKRIKCLYVGQLSFRKGVPAIAALSHRVDAHVQISIVTNSSTRAQEEMSTNSEVDRLNIINNPSRLILESAFRSSSVFLFPTFAEGFSLACIEAMSYGLIPIISYNSGVSEILEGTDLEAFIIEPGSATDMEKNILRLGKLTNHDFRRLRFLSYEISRSYTLDGFAEKLTRIVGYQ